MTLWDLGKESGELCDHHFAMSCQPEQGPTIRIAGKGLCRGFPEPPVRIHIEEQLSMKQPGGTSGFQGPMNPGAKQVAVIAEGIWNFRFSYSIFIFLASNPKHIIIPFWPSTGQI